MDLITLATMKLSMQEADLFDLFSWMSPAWPIGSFAHSGGLEWAVEAGHVTDRPTACTWIAALVGRGPIHADTVLFTHAWRAVRDDDGKRLRDVADLALASQTSFERHLESTAQGTAFMRIALATSGVPEFATRVATLQDLDAPYPVAAATLFASRGLAFKPALTAWLHGAVANLVSASQRLVPLGQTDGQILLRDCRPMVLAKVEEAAALPNGDPFEEMGSCSFMADLGCMAHETQYTRLFRT